MYANAFLSYFTDVIKLIVIMITSDHASSLLSTQMLTSIFLAPMLYQKVKFQLLIQMNKQFLGVLLLLVLAGATKLSLTLQSYQKQCFYQLLQSQQKYSMDVVPLTSGKYEVQISNMIDGKWNSIYYRQTKTELEPFNIHKLAPIDSTYSFCIRNIDNMEVRIKANIQSGLELMEFELLPDKSDSQNLERELSWLASHKSKLQESLDRTEGLRATSESLSSLMSFKMIGLAIAGLVSILAVNVVFYRLLKKTFKERKLI